MGCWTNTSYLTDFIQITLSPKHIETAKLVDLYVQKGLSASQIAEKIDSSKQMVLSRLRKAGIRNYPNKGRSPDNYRFRNPPYGYKVVKGRLLLNSRETKICRLIVGLRNKGMPWNRIAKELNSRQITSRKRTPWGHFMVQIIYNRWKGKV